MIVTGSFSDVRGLDRGAVGLVPTMGFLHEGHGALLDAARAAEETVVMSLFVNRLQFGEQHDLDVYPRDLDRDLAVAEAAGVDVVFAPDDDEMYPVEPVTRVVLASMAERMEGAHRPGHFEGVATVVTKLFAGLRPERAYFGRKDAQQLAIVRRMAADLSLPVEVVPISTVREPDGLALSSRNVLLDGPSREQARAISAVLFDVAGAVEHGERDATALAERARTALQAAPGVDPEYVEWATTTDLARPETVAEGMFLATAARVGGVRLIDNVHFQAAGESLVADRGTFIEGRSMLYDREED